MRKLKYVKLFENFEGDNIIHLSPENSNYVIKCQIMGISGNTIKCKEIASKNLTDPEFKVSKFQNEVNYKVDFSSTSSSNFSKSQNFTQNFTIKALDPYGFETSSQYFCTNLESINTIKRKFGKN